MGEQEHAEDHCLLPVSPPPPLETPSHPPLRLELTPSSLSSSTRLLRQDPSSLRHSPPSSCLHPLLLPTTTGEDPNNEDDGHWNFPSDPPESFCKQTLGVTESLLILATLAYSVLILIHENLYDTRRKLFYYAVAVLFSDLAVLSVAGIILSFSCCIGSYYVVQPFIGLFIQASRAITCYVFLGYGVYFLYILREDLYHQHPLLFGYLVAVSSVTLFYSIISCQTVCGALSFVMGHAWDKIVSRPLVEFHQPSRPTWFTYHFGVDRLAAHLSELNLTPTRRGGAHVRGRTSGRFNEPQFERGEEIGSLTETPMEELLHKMGLEEDTTVDAALEEEARMWKKMYEFK